MRSSKLFYKASLRRDKLSLALARYPRTCCQLKWRRAPIITENHDVCFIKRPRAALISEPILPYFRALNKKTDNSLFLLPAPLH